MKRLHQIIVATCAVVALSSSLALAAEAPAPQNPHAGHAVPGQPGGHSMSGHGAMMGPLAQLSPEKQEAAKKLMVANSAAMFPLHQSLYAKLAELEALNAGGEGESGKAKAVIRDIADLNAKMLQEDGKFRARMFKETGLRVPVMGHGAMGGMGMMGGKGGGGMGCGMMGGKGGMMGAMAAGATPPAASAAPAAGDASPHAGH
jgi:Spy/CpxP family protein refolding chaperone